MPTSITFAQIKSYLDAIADTADIDDSPHDRFWNIDYQPFITGAVPNVGSDPTTNKPVPIIDTIHPDQSSFYQVLLGPWHGFNQMPDGGPDVKTTTFQVGAKQVKGSDILNDMLNWLTNSYPENGN